MTFRVGMKVTLTSDIPFINMYPGESEPAFGLVYTVRDMEARGVYLGLVFEEIHNPDIYEGASIRECVFDSRRFRPVIDDRKKVSFTEGAPLDSEKWDNRAPVREYVR